MELTFRAIKPRRNRAPNNGMSVEYDRFGAMYMRVDRRRVAHKVRVREGGFAYSLALQCRVDGCAIAAAGTDTHSFQRPSWRSISMTAPSSRTL